MKPRGGSLTFESITELSLLDAGLDVIAGVVKDDKVTAAAAVMRQVSKDISGSTQTVMQDMANDPVLGSLMADAAPTGAELTFDDPMHVALARMAVSLVAANTPGSTESAHLQDPLVHQTALSMVDEYEQATGQPIYPRRAS